ncbi:helix-turn-helix transcriptional regulator [Corynebacterium kefirresidentii]|uniref:helix-turn-helix domain-containing protein n=1 Tax=Corynebacterium sp. MSK185 TaxID=3377092 RepID=UPI00254C72BB|nr:helix-turn-helix transcriptional regulator [Corynebacterium kefirresidentii]MDK8585747.1 helix-turn-helix transcriptional regulator [Corynebacterium kefirresidentii]
MTTNRTFSYKPLWKLLIDRDMNKTQLQERAGISPATLSKLGRGGNVTTDVLSRICEALDCDIIDICEVVKDEESAQ